MAPTSTQARAGAHKSWARTADRAARTSAGTAAFLARFEREVDPDGTLDPAERQRRAESAKRSYFYELAARSAAARRAAKSALVVDVPSPAPSTTSRSRKDAAA